MIIINITEIFIKLNKALHRLSSSSRKNLKFPKCRGGKTIELRKRRENNRIVEEAEEEEEEEEEKGIQKNCGGDGIQ